MKRGIVSEDFATERAGFTEPDPPAPRQQSGEQQEYSHVSFVGFGPAIGTGAHGSDRSPAARGAYQARSVDRSSRVGQSETGRSGFSARKNAV